jgi:hypothetical protein
MTSERKHYHVAKRDESGVLLDECNVCGESWRNTDVHWKVGERQSQIDPTSRAEPEKQD